MNWFKLFFLSSVILFSVWSCAKDPCSGVICKNGGACLDGNCVCQMGYRGADCGQQVRYQFVGDFVGDGLDKNKNVYSLIHDAKPAATKIKYSFEEILVDLKANMFDIENELKGINKPVTKCSECKYQPDDTELVQKHDFTYDLVNVYPHNKKECERTFNILPNGYLQRK